MSNGKRVRGISSPMGRLAFAQQKEQKVLTVDDPTEPVEPTEEDVAEDAERALIETVEAARREKREAQLKASPNAIRRLEILTGIGRLGAEVDIDGVVFSIRSLKGREMRDVMVAISQVDNAIEQIFEVRAQTIARAISKIDNQPFDLVLGSSDLDDKILFVQELDENVLVKLHNEYTAMVNASNKKVEEDLGTTAEEVVESVKKS